MTICKQFLTRFGAVLVVAAFAAAPAAAQGVGPYAGFNLGVSSSSDFEDFCSDVPGSSCTKNPMGFKILGGYQFNPNFAIEGGYYSSGDFDITAFSSTVTFDATTFFVEAVGIIPVNPTVSLFGKLGIHFWDVEASGPGGSVSEDGSDPVYGFGAKFAVSKTAAIRVEWERYETSQGGDSFNINFLSAGVELKF